MAGVGAGLPLAVGQVPPGFIASGSQGFPWLIELCWRGWKGLTTSIFEDMMELASLIMKITGWPRSGVCSSQSGTLRPSQRTQAHQERCGGKNPVSDPPSDQAMASGERLILETAIHTTASSHIVKDD
jgi:hypothetical protein